ncbi:SRPBCC family protein [Streptomyces daliensis]|uniref:SRPBCC family protein n=1 Tax=Streptomyces daliensis TaxID=299421 RepID=A0A8T4IQP8_9ACTN|nr:SRPBCC family protein [Streptomyces daliensis]
MRLTNTVPVKAAPDEVFALVNDVERVVSCMPGAALEGREGDAWRGRVKVKVGPVTAAYAGTVRFLETDAASRTLRVQARGADAHGNGDAEAEVRLEVVRAPDGAELRLDTDLVIRGKIAQFGKGAVAAVSDRILQQFARNLGSLLDQPVPDGSGAAQPPSKDASAPGKAGEPEALNGLAVLAGPALSRYGPVVGAFAFGLFEGWLLGRVLAHERQHGCGVARRTR